MGMSQMNVQQSTQPTGKGGFSSIAQQQNTQQNPINGLYRQVLGRDAEAEGMNYWSQRFGNTIEPNEVEEFTRGAQPEIQGRTNSATSGQPQFGQPNMYPNTVRPWDNASIMPTQQTSGKGGGGYQQAQTNFSQQPRFSSGKSGGKFSR